MVFTRLHGLILAVSCAIPVNGQAPAAPASSSTSSATTPSATLLLKFERPGTVTVDGKEPVNVQGGQTQTFTVQPGQHLVSWKSKDGKTSDKVVQATAGASTVELIGAPSSVFPFRKKTEVAKKPRDQHAQAPITEVSTDPQRAQARVAALHILQNYTAEVGEASRFHIANAESDAKENLDKLRTQTAKTTTPASLLALGQPQQAFSLADEELKAWSRFDPIPPDLTLELDLEERAVARFASGSQPQGIADLEEVERLLSFALPPPEGKDDPAIADLKLPQQLAAMKAVAGDWRGCTEELTALSKDEFDRDSALRDLALGCKALAPAAPSALVQSAFSAAVTAPEAVPQPFVYPVQEHVRLFALEQLGLLSEARKEAVSSGIGRERTALIEARIDTARKQKAKLEIAAGHPVPSSLLLQLGELQQALHRSDEELREQTALLDKAQALKARCSKCTDVTDVFLANVGSARQQRATALFANGQREQGIEEAAEAQKVFSRSERLQAKDPAKSSSYYTDDSYDQIAAMKALIGDWDGCLAALRQVSDDDPNSAKRAGVLWKGCYWMKASSPTHPAQQAPGLETATIQNQIGEVMKSGKYSAMPGPRVLADETATGPPHVTIKNDARLNLTVLCAGAAECSVQVPPGQTVEVQLPAGHYQMLGRFESSNAAPAFEQYAFEKGFIYAFDFITATP